MKLHAFFWCCAICALCMLSCNQSQVDFVQVSEHGFDAEDHARDNNDYPWSMISFAPDGADNGGHLYVGTGNGIINFMMKRSFAVLGLDFNPEPYALPPEIRRYRPDLGQTTWETVLDYRDIEVGPDWQTAGIRSLGVYSMPGGERYLYAGTFGSNPSVWRSATGDYGTWERVWESPGAGSVRAFLEHDELLYFSVTYEIDIDSDLPGTIHATDGETIWSVIEDGFGNPNNIAIFELCAFAGYVYAGTYNKEEGYEVWKFGGLNGDDSPQLIVRNGGPSRSNQGAATMKVFNGHLYVGALIAAGINSGEGPVVRGADMIRIRADDTWETVVGPEAVVPTGFGKRTHAYLWSMEEHNGRLYCGVWDSLAFIRVTRTYMPQIEEQFQDMNIRDVLELFRDRVKPSMMRDDTGINLVREGAALYVTDDGLDWHPVFRTGLGNPRNMGVRRLSVHDGHLYAGMANIWDGLIIYKMADH